MPEINRKPTARQIEVLRTGLTNPEGIIEVSADKRTHEGLVGRDLADWVAPEKVGVGRSVWGSALCVINKDGREFLAKLDAAEGNAAEERAEVIDTPAGELLEPGSYEHPTQAGTHAKPYFQRTMIKVGVREDGRARRVHGMECRACGVVGTRKALEGQPCTPEREAEIVALQAITAAPTREAKRAAVAAVSAAGEAPLPPVESEFDSMHAAVDFLASLKGGDRVRITQGGRTRDYTVTMPARRSGSQGTTKVTVSLGPGRYSFEVSAGNLFAQRGDKATMTLGGTKMMRTPTTTTQEDTVTKTPASEPDPQYGQQYGGITREDVARGNGPAEVLWRAGEFFKMYDEQHPAPTTAQQPEPNEWAVRNAWAVLDGNVGIVQGRYTNSEGLPAVVVRLGDGTDVHTLASAADLSEYTRTLL